MARARNIKPGFFQDDKLGEISPLARLLFIGLWTIADFKGCLEYRPKMLKVQILPYDECDIDALSKTLEQNRFIRMYSVEEKTYIKIVNFERHQNPHKNEKDAGSNIPDFIENNELNKDGTKPDKIGTARADSLLLIPDSNTHSTTRAGALCKQLRQIGIEAAPHQPQLLEMLNKHTDEQIIAVAEIAVKRKPGERVSIGYLAPMLADAGKPVKKTPPPEDFSKRDYGKGIVNL